MKTFSLTYYIKFAGVLLSILILFAVHAKAEIIYLKDGQVLEGKIIAETTQFVIIKTKYLQRKVWRTNIRRIMLKDRKMEPIHILMKNGDTIKGYLVDQTATKVFIKDAPNSKKEKTILKKFIKQMSNEKIVPLDTAITIRMGYFESFNSGGADLRPATAYLIGAAINLPWTKKVRGHFEAGYIDSESRANDKSYMQFYPMMISALIDINFGSFSIIPKIGIGAYVLNYFDGETQKVQSAALGSAAGFGLQYELLQRALYISAWGEYRLITDGDIFMHSILVCGGLTYRF